MFLNHRPTGQTTFYDPQGRVIDADAQLQLGVQWVESEKFYEAAKLFKNFNVVEYSRPESFYYNGYAYSHGNGLDQVIKRLRDGLEWSAQERETLAQIIANSRDIIEASIRDLTVAITLNPKYIEAYQHRMILNAMINNVRAVHADGNVLKSL